VPSRLSKILPASDEPLTTYYLLFTFLAAAKIGCRTLMKIKGGTGRKNSVCGSE